MNRKPTQQKLKKRSSYLKRDSFYHACIDCGVQFSFSEKILETIFREKQWLKLENCSKIATIRIFSYNRFLLYLLAKYFGIKNKFIKNNKKIYYLELNGIALIRKFFKKIKPHHLTSNKQVYSQFLSKLKRLKQRRNRVFERKKIGKISPYNLKGFDILAFAIHKYSLRKKNKKKKERISPLLEIFTLLTTLGQLRKINQDYTLFIETTQKNGLLRLLKLKKRYGGYVSQQILHDRVYCNYNYKLSFKKKEQVLLVLLLLVQNNEEDWKHARINIIHEYDKAFF